MDIEKSRWEKMARRNSKFYIASSLGKQATDEDFRQSGKKDYTNLILNDHFINLRETILDHGCGIGRMTEFMAKDFNKVYGVDISKEMIRQGKERLKKYKNVVLHETNGQLIPLEKESIDVVFSYLVFQHIKKFSMIEITFREIHRILAPTGIFKVLLRHTKEPMRRWNAGVAFDKKSIEAMCDKIGFMVFKTDYTDDCYTFWAWLVKK